MDVTTLYRKFVALLLAQSAGGCGRDDQESTAMLVHAIESDTLNEQAFGYFMAGLPFDSFTTEPVEYFPPKRLGHGGGRPMLEEYEADAFDEELARQEEELEEVFEKDMIEQGRQKSKHQPLHFNQS
jgi:hypothetical protein